METNRLPDVDDAQLLEFLAEHRFIVFSQAQALLKTSAPRSWARLRALEANGLIRRERPFGGRHCFFLITTNGLRTVGSRLSRPRFHLGCYEHDLGAAWLCLAARAGAFGPLSHVISERRMRSADATAAPGSRPLAVRLGGIGDGGRERLHYPDLLLVTPDGKRVAVELELSAKGRARRERILGGYAADVRVDTVLYLVGNRALGHSIRRSARAMGIEHLVRVQMASLSDPVAAGKPAERVAARSHAKSARELA